MGWKYDVFLSFRGKDTRKTFVDHLYSSLVQHGIYTYKDDETLIQSQPIRPSILQAIYESQIAVVIFSENYADSSWCLDELECIMKCNKERGKIVMPVFYDVEPSEVRKQKGTYDEPFAKYKLENSEKVESWREALVDASNIAGWEPKHIANGHEAKCIKEIVDTISYRLHPVISGADENLIGIEGRLQDVISKLEIRSGGVIMLGIWGVGGGGKTTLASSVYDEISGGFDSCCFVENIREKSSRNGLEELKEKILSMGLRRNGEGRSTIKSTLCRRKVLIVLDDVDHLEQLTTLAGSYDWFGEGSRIIITTRDEHLLNAHRVNVIHNVSLLNDDEAIKLFHKHAYRVDYTPVEDYKLLAKDVVSYSNGLPLALKVLGSYLCDKNTNEWKSALARLKEIPHNDILKKLKISFDGLQPDEKQLFLDIACFFRGEFRKETSYIHDACGFHSVIGVKVLIEKALITINLDGEFDMHDLVQEMGHYIVRGQYPKNPEKHDRVWEIEDVQKICAMDAMTTLDKIEAIRVISHDDRLSWHHNQVVANMKKLRWIEWVGFSESSLPTNFPPGELCCLMLSGFNLKQLWEGYKYLPNLRMIKLDHMENLIRTPDFEGLPNLERFFLSRSLKIEEIHPSISALERLVSLIITECDNLKTFPCISLLQKLETFTLENCPKLFKATETQQNIDNDTKYNHIASQFFHTALTKCMLACCTKLLNEEADPCFLPHININSNDIGLHLFNRALTKLTLSGCNLGDGDMDLVVWELSSLQELSLGSNNFSRLDFGLWKLPRLKSLDVSWCDSLVALSGLPSSIAVLRADRCDSLERVEDITNCKWLWKVSFFGKNKLGLLGDHKILDSMLQGNATEDHFISFTLSGGDRIPKELSSWHFWKTRFTLQLPGNWYSDFSGFLICCHRPLFTITIKEELEKDGPTKVWPLESNEEHTPGPCFLDLRPPTYVGYVSFGLVMRLATRMNSAYNAISFSFTPETRLEAKLIRWKSKSDRMETKKGVTDWSGFYVQDDTYRKTFTVQHHSKSSIKILWNPHR